MGASGTALREELEEADEEDDLPLARLRDLIPRSRRRLRGVVARDVDRELHAVGVPVWKSGTPRDWPSTQHQLTKMVSELSVDATDRGAAHG